MPVASTQETTVDHTAPHRVAGSIGKNTIFGIIASAFQVGTRFVTVPVVITHLGLDGYGIWAIIMTAAAYMRFGSMGIKSAFQKYVAESTGNGEYEKTNELLSTGCAAMFVLSLLGLVPVCFFSRQLAKAAGVPSEFLTSTARSILVLALTMVIANTGAAYEAIVMGGHRIDLARKFNSALTVAEAVAIISVLHYGYGLFAMTLVMAASELVFIGCCYAVSHRVAPQVHVAIRFVTKRAAPELTRFAGSYQLVSVLQILSGAIPQIAILRVFGAEASGVVALASRLLSPMTMCQSAFLVPILSGGAMIYATGVRERMHNLLAKAYKVMLGATFIPLGLVATFGTYAIQAWTGQSDPRLGGVIWLGCLGALFQSFSLLFLVLYRVSGKALLDIVRESLRIATTVLVIAFAHALGFYGVIGGFALAELAGLLCMIFAMFSTFETFQAKTLLPDTVRLALAAVGIVVFAAFAVHFVPSYNANPRLLATLRVGAVGIAALISVYPFLHLTGALSSAEARSIVAVFKTRTAVTDPTTA